MEGDRWWCKLCNVFVGDNEVERHRVLGAHERLFEPVAWIPVAAIEAIQREQAEWDAGICSSNAQNWRGLLAIGAAELNWRCVEAHKQDANDIRAQFESKDGVLADAPKEEPK